MSEATNPEEHDPSVARQRAPSPAHLHVPHGKWNVVVTDPRQEGAHRVLIEGPVDVAISLEEAE